MANYSCIYIYNVGQADKGLGCIDILLNGDEDAETINDDICSIVNRKTGIPDDCVYPKFNLILNESHINLMCDPLVYFVRCGETIKIGHSSKFANRMFSLQTGNPERLVCEKIIGCESVKSAYKLEKELHKKYRRFNIRGEWFSEDVLNDI